MDDYFKKPDSATKKAALFEEFPFLSRYASQNRIDFARVKRIGEDLLGAPRLWGRVYLLDKDGQEIAKVRLASIWSLLRRRESILDTLKRIKDRVDEIQFILSIYAWSCDPELSGKVSLKLYKVPSQETIRDVVDRLKQDHEKDFMI